MKSPSSYSICNGDKHYETGCSTSRYCEVCKWKSFRNDQLNYNPESLLQVRDLIKYIHCLGCESRYETKIFISHAADCWWSNNVPVVNLKSVYKQEERKLWQPNFGLSHVMKTVQGGAV